MTPREFSLSYLKPLDMSFFTVRPPKWARARVCLLYKKGDARTASNYRPICLIQSIVQLAAAWQCAQLTAITARHSLLHTCQHGGLKGHRCGDHIYDVVARMLLTKGRLYHLYIDFNKAFNSVPLEALWKTLHGYSLPRDLISSIQRLYIHAYEQPIVEGVCTAGHAQRRGVRQGCPLSPLLFNLYVNMMFFYLDSKMEWNIERSIHAFIDNILFRARSLQDVRTVFEAFDGPARSLGLDMNVDKTELHALRGSGHAEIVSRHGGKISTLDSRGQPRSCYKYLGVFFYTSDFHSKVMDFVHTEINAFFVRLAPLQLTATELISLVNKQLIPVLAYRLMAGPVTDAQLHKIQQSIWHGVARYGRLPHHLSQKDRHLGRPQGCFSLMPFQTFMRSQIFNYSMRYLNCDGPPQCSMYVPEALKARKANWLQNAFVDSVYALGGRCHGFGEWNPCPVERLLPEERVHVEFISGWFSGTVISYSAPDSAALIKFDVDNTLFHIQDKRHNFTTHPPPPSSTQWSRTCPSITRLPPHFCVPPSPCHPTPSPTLQFRLKPMSMDTCSATQRKLNRLRYLPCSHGGAPASFRPFPTQLHVSGFGSIWMAPGTTRSLAPPPSSCGQMAQC